MKVLISLLTLLAIALSLPTPTLAAAVPPPCPADMAFIPGGKIRLGSNLADYPEEQVVEDVTVSPFCIGKHEVTNAEFAEFVAATGYITVAERPLSPEQFPDLPDDARSPGSVVFQIPPAIEGQDIPWLSWWQWVPGANWQHPEGPESDIRDRPNHPVVHIAYEDAAAYAAWAGLALPTEAQWEYAASGGLVNAIFSWGNRYSAKKANTWQGQFPTQNTEADGYFRTAPVGTFPPNAYGLSDTIGNVWEWTQDWYTVDRPHQAHQVDPIVADAAQSYDPREPGVAKHVIKGGSFLCAKNYCSRYRLAAREAESPDTGMSHIGFRLVKNLGTVDNNT